MAQKIVDICDGCNKEFIREKFNGRSELSLYAFECSDQIMPHPSVKVEICNKCANDFVEFFSVPHFNLRK